MMTPIESLKEKTNYFFDPDGLNFKFTSSSKGKYLEFLYFFLNRKEALYSVFNYTDEYKKYLENEFNIKLRISNNNLNLQNYWLNTSSKEISLKLNDKIFFKEILNKYSIDQIPWFYDTQKIILNEFKEYIIKQRAGYSGIGFKKVPGDALVNRKCTIPSDSFIEEFKEKLWDLSILVMEEKVVFYEVITNELFRVEQISFDKNNDGIENLCLYLKNKNIYNVETVIKNIQNIINEVYAVSESKKNIFSIDLFAYAKQGKKHAQFSEVNFRKTLGYCFYQIWKIHFRDLKSLSFLIYFSKTIKNSDKMNKKNNIKLLSPKKNPIRLYVKY